MAFTRPKVSEKYLSKETKNLEVHLYHPRQDKWEEHFVWNEDKTIILGISPIGRGTISCLKINREEAVNLRKALKMFGVHPPKKF